MRAETDLLGHARAADVGRSLPDARRQHADRHDIAGDRQRIDDVAGDDLRTRRLLDVDLGRLARNGNRLFERTDFQIGVDRDDDFRRHVDAVTDDRAEAGQGEGELVGARPQRFNTIAALIVGDRRPDFFDDCRARGLDGDAGKNAAGFVANLADDLRLCKCR